MLRKEKREKIYERRFQSQSEEKCEKRAMIVTENEPGLDEPTTTTVSMLRKQEKKRRQKENPCAPQKYCAQLPDEQLYRPRRTLQSSRAH